MMPASRSGFSVISLVLSALAILVSLFIVVPLFGSLRADEHITRPPVILIYFIYLILIAGTILSMMGFKRKEKPAIIKWSAFILNLVLLVAVVALIIYAMSMSR